MISLFALTKKKLLLQALWIEKFYAQKSEAWAIKMTQMVWVQIVLQSERNFAFVVYFGCKNQFGSQLDPISARRKI